MADKPINFYGYAAINPIITGPVNTIKMNDHLTSPYLQMSFNTFKNRTGLHLNPWNTSLEMFHLSSVTNIDTDYNAQHTIMSSTNGVDWPLSVYGIGSPSNKYHNNIGEMFDSSGNLHILIANYLDLHSVSHFKYTYATSNWETLPSLNLVAYGATGVGGMAIMGDEDRIHCITLRLDGVVYFEYRLIEPSGEWSAPTSITTASTSTPPWHMCVDYSNKVYFVIASGVIWLFTSSDWSKHETVYYFGGFNIGQDISIFVDFYDCIHIVALYVYKGSPFLYGGIALQKPHTIPVHDWVVTELFPFSSTVRWIAELTADYYLYWYDGINFRVVQNIYLFHGYTTMYYRKKESNLGYGDHSGTWGSDVTVIDDQVAGRFLLPQIFPLASGISAAGCAGWYNRADDRDWYFWYTDNWGAFTQKTPTPINFYSRTSPEPINFYSRSV